MISIDQPCIPASSLSPWVVKHHTWEAKTEFTN